MINNKKHTKTQKGITLVALVITIVILIILATVTINMAFGDNGLVKYAEEARDKTANSTIAEAEGINSMVDQFANVLAEEGTTTKPEEPSLPTDGSYNAEKGVNTPKLGTNMELVKFDEETQDWVVDETNSAYNYVDTSTEGNTNKSEWANAKVTTQVGDKTIESYFIWIPRYAYKIIGENNIDIKFIEGTGKTTTDGIQCKYASENPTTDDYIIHPAFTDEVNNGGWNSQIAGIWIGKYETARSDTEGATDGSATTLKVQPGVTSFRNITIGDMYTYAKAYDKNLKSHMLKNSEWGAVAYLTESKYGRNGIEVTINNNGITYYTGGGADKTYTTSTDQSSTGNVYGIYDLSGNAVEYVATGYQNQSSIGTSSGSNEYGTIYTETSASTGYKYGDATYETSGWHSAGADFVNSSIPFFFRGGSYQVGSNAGVFYSGGGSGDAYDRSSFRLTLVV